jgi:hypothetical protein
MKKKSLFVIISLFIILSANPLFAQFREGINQKPDTSLTFQELVNPMFQTFPIAESQKQNKIFTQGQEPQPLKLNKVSKSLLGIGADLIRGSTNDLPLYNLENGWKYPGPTIQYPTDITEYKGFLRRYNRYNSDL